MFSVELPVLLGVFMLFKVEFKAMRIAVDWDSWRSAVVLSSVVLFSYLVDRFGEWYRSYEFLIVILKIVKRPHEPIPAYSSIRP